MTARDFVFWLQGVMEVGNPSTLDERQVKTIREHLDLVFKHDIAVPAAGEEAGPFTPAQMEMIEKEMAKVQEAAQTAKLSSPRGAVRIC